MKTRSKFVFYFFGILLLSFIHSVTYGQYYRLNADTNIRDILNSFYENYDGSIDTFEGSEFRRFQRWENFWKPRLSPSGSFQNAQNKIDAFIASYNPADFQSDIVSSNWVELGPRINGIEGIGLVTDIEFHPTDPNILLCGSSGGGVWKTTDGGLNWHNLNTDKQLIRLGVSTIVIDPTDPDIIYIGTGDVDYEFSYSDGVY